MKYKQLILQGDGKVKAYREDVREYPDSLLYDLLEFANGEYSKLICDQNSVILPDITEFAEVGPDGKVYFKSKKVEEGTRLDIIPFVSMKQADNWNEIIDIIRKMLLNEISTFDCTKQLVDTFTITKKK